MKRLLCVLLTIGLLAGCSSGISPSEYERVVSERDALRAELDAAKNAQLDVSLQEKEQSSTESSKTTEINSEPTIAASSEQVSVQEIGTYKNSIGTCYTVLVLTNNSANNLEISVDISFKDGDGNLIGAKSSSEKAVPSGVSIAMGFSSDSMPSSYTYDVSVKEDRYYIGVTDNITHDVSIADKKAIVTATNNGNASASFLEATALFFKGDELVNHGTAYCTDSDSELKAGKTVNKEISCYPSFDRVEVYFTGRADR